ncbi:MAG: ATP-grasp domain-containing protein [Planctomycetes bacterium]|nr:ATP-grasp domain-containing protein [Planctomycetota bacterium]
MPNVVFCVPFFREASLRFVRGIADLPGVRLGLVTQDHRSALPADLDRRLAGHWQVQDGLDGDALVAGVRGCAGQMGGVDRVVGMLEQLQVPLGYVRDRLGIEGMGESVARNFREKALMKDVLRAHGVPCARHRLCTDANELRSFAALVGYPLVAKPPAGAGAKATFRIENGAALEDAVRAMAPSPARPLQVEEFMTGREHSFDAVNLGSRTVWHSLSRYEPSPLTVLENPWIQWTVLVPREIDHPQWDDIRAVATKALRALGMTSGVSHMEWFRRPDGSVAVSEVGARPPGAQICTLHSLAHDFDFYAAWGRAVVFDEFTPPERRFAAGAAYLRAQGKGRTIKAVHGLDQAQREVGELVVEARLPRVGAEATGTYEGDGYVVLRHASTEVVERALRRLITLVRVELG